MTHGLEIYTDVLTPEACNTVIHLFNQDDRRAPGMSTKHADKVVSDSKISTDLMCNLLDDQWQYYNQLIYPGIRTMVENIKQTYLFLDHCDYWRICPYYNIQYYGEGEGYFTPHCEQGNRYPERMLAWMIYLNTAQCGTEFPYQKIKVRALQGQGAIWSAAWTHPHKGITPNIGDKYIATGWCEYYTPDQLKDELLDQIPRETTQWSSHPAIENQ